MNRRGFIDAALKAAAGFAILPGATTYARAWKPTRKPELAWVWGEELTVDQWFRRNNIYVPMPPLEWDRTVIDPLTNLALRWRRTLPELRVEVEVMTGVAMGSAPGNLLT